MSNNFFFVRVAWMSKYQGVQNDTPHGAGWWVDKNGTGGEVYNFLPVKGKYYGFSRNQDNRTYDLTRVGALKADISINNMTVVFFATNPDYGGQFVIGWYKNATVYKQVQTLETGGRKEFNFYNFNCKIADGTLIEVQDRWLRLPKGPGETNVWYPKTDNKEHQNWLKKLSEYIINPNSPNIKTGRGPYQKDIEKKKAVELAAMDVAWVYFEKRGFVPNNVSNENKGWDLEAVKGSKKVLIEVKGLSGDLGCIELSANEYRNSTLKDYRIAIVSNALDEKPTIEIFKYQSSNNIWCGDKNILRIQEKKSAILTKTINN